MRVLLVEDDTSTAKSIELMLKSEGYIIDTTDLGEDGLEIGKIYDEAKLAKAGGEVAFAALQPGPELSAVLAYAAERSFQIIAVVPVLLFLIFGLVWAAERRSPKA